MKDVQVFSKPKPKYPFIETFVNSMNNIQAHDFVSSDLDLKSLLVFFQIYIYVCRMLKKEKIQLSPENITKYMEVEYEIWILDPSKSSSLKSITF